MGAVMHETLRRKIGAARASRPPLRDPDFICDLFARLLEEKLRAAFHGPVGVGVRSGGGGKLSEMLKSEQPPALYAVAETPGDRLGAVMTLSAALVHRAVAGLTRAATASAPSDRMPTAIDEALVQCFVEDVIDCFERAVISGPRPESGIALAFARFARRSTSLAEAPDQMDTIAFEVEMAFGDDTPPYAFRLILPLGALDIYRAAEKAAASVRPSIGRLAVSGELWASAMISAARSAEFRFVGVLAEVSMTVEEISALAPGSIIQLPEERTLEVSLRIDQPGGLAGKPELATGVLGAADGRRAVKIGAPPDPQLTDGLQAFIA